MDDTVSPVTDVLSAEQRRIAWLFEAAARRFPDHLLLAAAEPVSYAAAGERARGIAQRLAAAGLRPGDRVVIVGANSPDAILLALGVAYAGGIFTILHEQIRPVSLRRVLARVAPALVAFDDTAAAAVGAVAAPRTLRLDGDLVRGPGAPPGQGFPVAHGSGEDPALLVFTSGSTGDAHGVTATHENVLFSVAAIQDRLGYRTDDVVGLFLPLAFDYGLYQLFLAANVGATVVVGDARWVGPGLLRAVAEAGISILPLVPAQAVALVRLLERRPPGPTRLRAITSTGERLAPAVADALERLLPDVEVYPMYGLTECKRVAIMPAGRRHEAPRSAGVALRGTSVVAVGEDGRRLGPGEWGELVVRGPHVTAGYWGEPDATAARFRTVDGVRQLRTGDLGRVDAAGFVEVGGRLDAIVKRRSFRISLLEIEQAACEVAGVLEAVAMHRADDDCLQLLMTCEREPDESRVLAHLRDRLEPYKLPDRLRFVQDLPRTATGKVDRARLAHALPPVPSG